MLCKLSWGLQLSRVLALCQCLFMLSRRIIFCIRLLASVLFVDKSSNDMYRIIHVYLVTCLIRLTLSLNLQGSVVITLDAFPCQTKFISQAFREASVIFATLLRVNTFCIAVSMNFYIITVSDYSQKLHSNIENAS